ncbi:MAG: cache domain-containing protein [Alphaproteobacteria bacterium]|nr:cache domain-containing protein [Alphaproteobacteria bacterium]
MMNIFARLKSAVSQRQLKFDILSSFFVLQFITAFFIAFYMYSCEKEILINFSDKMMADLSEFKTHVISDHFTDVQKAIALASESFEHSDEAAITNQNLIDTLVEILSQYPYIESVYIGTESGVFFQANSLEEGKTYRTVPDKLLPRHAVISIRVTDRASKIPNEIWYYLDKTNRIIDKETLPESEITYNHKERPWYIKAIDTQAKLWTDIYVFNTTNVPGITAATPIFSGSSEALIGVIGANIPLSSVSTILKTTTIKGLSTIINKKGEIVADPTGSNMAKILHNKSEAHLIRLDEIADKLQSTGFKDYIATQKNRFVFDYNNAKYMASYSEFDKSLVDGWLFSIIVPLDSLIGVEKETQEKGLLFAILLLLGSTCIVSYLARRISRPINALAQQADKITNFDMSTTSEVHSGILEIQHLQSSISRMQRSISSFGKFVPKSLVKKLIDKGIDVKIGGKSRHLTILFTDIANFTGISETYPPEKLMLHLSAYFEEMTNIIIKENGTIDKYIGDAIMSFWGAPHADQNHALHACKAALLCQRRLVDLNREWIFDKKPALNTRIGIHSGDVIVGNLGSFERMNYTILGDSVNLAARLEGTNKNYGTLIIISHATYKHIENFAIVRPLDIVAVKGKNEGVHIYELVALHGTNPLVLPTEEQLNFCAKFTKAFQLYLDQRWDEAIAAFKELRLRYPEDLPCSLYIERCEQFAQTPPPKDWDGINRLTKK